MPKTAALVPMHRIQFLLISLILVACSTTSVFEMPIPLQPSATVTTPTLAKPRVTPTVAVKPGITPTVAASKTRFPTITPLGGMPTQLEPGASPTKDLVGLWRVRHDVERDEWGFKSRLWVKNWKKLRGLPETVRVNGGRGTVILSPAWVEFLNKINTPDAQRFLRKLQSGWLNYGPFPKMEQVIFGGDYVYVTRVADNRAYIKTFNNAYLPPENGPDKTSPETMSHDPLIHIFSTVYTDGSWEMATPVGLVFTFVIANPDDGPLWIDIRDLIRK